VWNAEWPASKKSKPVMLWIHGGGNFGGTSLTASWDGESLARRDVIVVGANYRLGIFGFFAHAALTNESARHASGNYGLMDQIAAMRWIQANIKQFGGDPNNVTVFGESAGSMDINMLMASPLTRGLMHRVIGESGSLFQIPSLAESEKRGAELIAPLKLVNNTDMLKALRAIPRAELVEATPKTFALVGPAFGMIVDGWVFPRSPVEVFAEGKQNSVDLLIGSNSREIGRPFFPMDGDLEKSIRDQYGPLTERARRVYGLADGNTPAAHPVYGDAVAQWATDNQFRCSAVAELLWHADAKHVGYQYEFARVAPGRESAGATHAAELPYVFGTLRGSYNDIDRKVSSEMQTYWTNFAKSGNPNGSGLPAWPRFDSKTRAYIEFTADGPFARQGLRREACDLFTENLKRQMRR
jgi:para-nitrobenzyl esterase